MSIEIVKGNYYKCSNCIHWIRTTNRGGECHMISKLVWNEKIAETQEAFIHTQSYHSCKDHGVSK